MNSYTVADLAGRWQCKPHVVLDLIDAGELPAIDVSRPGSKRPRWRILPVDLEAFEERRRAKPKQKPQRRATRQASGPQPIGRRW
jgi:hypothetical protein